MTGGQYDQASGNLCVERKGNYAFCCLGVLCQMYTEAHGADTGWEATQDVESPDIRSGSTGKYLKGRDSCDHDVFSHLGEKDFPNKKVMEWAGVTKKTASDLADKNDNGATYKEIAEWVEENL